MYTVETYIIEILAALIGFSYPFIFQIIGSIDDKYNSVNMVALFRKEWCYRSYNVFLILTVILALCIPLTKTVYNSDSPFVWKSLQFVAYFILCLTLINLALLLRLTWIYYMPIKLQERLEYKLKNEAIGGRKYIRRLNRRLRKLGILISRAPRSLYYVSETEIQGWRDEILKVQNKIEDYQKIIQEGSLVFKSLTDLLKYSIGGTDSKLYIECGATFAWARMECTVKQYSDNQAIYYPYANVTASILNAINMIVQECINKSSLNPSLTNPSNYLYFLFPIDGVVNIPENAYRCIWYNLTKYERYGKHEWIESFWGWMVQYANLGFYDIPANSHNEQLFRLRDFSDCLMAYLLYKGHLKLVMKMRRYSNSSPYKNLLIPKSLSDCCEHLSAIGQPLMVSNRYTFDSNAGVKDHNLVDAWLKLYYLLSISLYPTWINDLKDHKFSVSQKLELKNKLDWTSELLSFWEALNNHVQHQYANAFIIEPEAWQRIISILNWNDEVIRSITDELKDTCKYLESNLSEIRRSEKVDSSQENFTKQINESILNFMRVNSWPVDFVDSNNHSIEVIMPPSTVPKDFFSEQREIGYVNIDDTLKSIYIQRIADVYGRSFILTSPVKRYCIDHREVIEALRRLNLTSEFSVISFGLDIKNIEKVGIEGTNLHRIPSKRGIICVLRTIDVPKIHLNNNIVQMEYTETEEPTKSETPDSNLPTPGIKIQGYANVEIEEPEQILRYIQITPVLTEYQGVQSQLSDITSISDYIVA